MSSIWRMPHHDTSAPKDRMFPPTLAQLTHELFEWFGK
jgi:hypothetical protein